jgi:hypothetical protein
MSVHISTRVLWKFLLAVAMLAPAAGVLAADPSDTSDASASSATNASTGVDLFAAIRSGDLDVKFIPRDSRRAQVLIKNNTDQPLNVTLPDAFVGMPVLAQAAGGAGGNRATTTNTNKQNQSVGGGMGGGQAGGAFSVPPEKVVKVQVDVVCLNYGSPEPNARIPYTIEPAEKYTTDPEVQELCRMLGDGKLDQRAAQAAAWHLANHMTWEELADLKLNSHLPQQYVRPYFTADEINKAMGIVGQAIKAADARKQKDTIAATSSASTTAASSGTPSLRASSPPPTTN